MPDNTEWEQIIDSGWIPESFAGYRSWSNGQYYYQGSYGYYWSSSPYSQHPYYAYFYSGGGNIAPYNGRGSGFSVRCLKN